MIKEKTMAKKKTEKRTQKKAKKTSSSSARRQKAPAVEEVTAMPAAAPAQPRTPDARLPAPGTVLQKRDRHGAVRCECTVEEAGVRYAGNVYRSLSSAAMVAAKDLGLTNKTQNGFVFWGLTKPPRRPSDPLAALERAWERYRGSVESIVKEGVTDENRSKVLATIRKHSEAIETLREKVA
jgi:hypothetical protein